MNGYGLNRLGELTAEVSERAGWHDPREVSDLQGRTAQLAATAPEKLCLIHSEVSEALETFRTSGYQSWFEVDGKPEGWGPELADVAIRLAELAYLTGTDLDNWIEVKLAFNDHRKDVPSRTGGKSL